MALMPIYEGNSLVVTANVVTSAGAVFDLTGATVTAAAAYDQDPSGAVADVTATVTITDASGGVAKLDFGTGALSEGLWTVQIEVSKSGEIQTVKSDTVEVRKSVPALLS